MARLASQEKMGFYPTPPVVVEQLEKLLTFTPGCRCIDTCCGEGEALATLTAGKDVETYGVELDRGRAEVARQKLTKVLNCDAIGETRITNNAFDLLFLNPPYDWETKEEQSSVSERTEKRFLQFHLRYLSSRGILIYVIPFTSIKYVTRMFSKFRDLRVLAFPEAEYRYFKQVVIIGKGAVLSTKEMADNNRHMLENISKFVDPERAYEYLWTTENIVEAGDYCPHYNVEKNVVELKNFTTSRIVPEDILPLISSSSLYDELEKEMSVASVESVRPLSMLRNGHLAMLLASGMMDGLLINDKHKLIVKGNISSFMEEISGDKDDFEVEENTSNHNVTVEKRVKRYEVRVRALDLNTLKYIDIK